eukprot:3178456-Prymnesium_polylepis.1
MARATHRKIVWIVDVKRSNPDAVRRSPKLFRQATANLWAASKTPRKSVAMLETLQQWWSAVKSVASGSRTVALADVINEESAVF